jgi:hypothetical protein
VQEALDSYLAVQGSRRDRINDAMALAGTLDPHAADALEESVRRIRSTWR